MTYLLSIDPGMSTGIVLGRYDREKPYERIDRWQVEGGLTGFIEFYDDFGSDYLHGGVVVVEKFVPLRSNRTFRVDELEPIRIEGAIQMVGISPVWQRAASMVLAGGDTPAQRKRASDDVLRRMGLWSTGSQVGRKDANDVNSAQKHAIAYLKSIKHLPTLEALDNDAS